MSTSWAQPSPSRIPPAQSIADAALSYFGNGGAIAQPTTPVEPDFSQFLPPAPPPIKVTGPVQDTPPTTPGPLSHLRAIPSLLRFVDHDLIQDAAAHNRPPPHAKATCTICSKDWDSRGWIPSKSPAACSSDPLAITSTFLSLPPCGHWAHYRCLIWQATRNNQQQRDKCAACGIQLFVWEGITALTLAARTKLDMEDTQLFATSDAASLDAENTIIDGLVHAQFFAALAQPSKYSDGSPDLIGAFYGVLEALQRMGKPTARWLQYSTQTGNYLYGSWVAIRLRRYLVEQHGKIQGTEGWREYVEGMEALKGRIRGEVHKK